ncbi:MAG TPA: glycosyltransferase [Burkholderiaceae bacterium]|nr:glycosyltransferase [Burkholderiaceae bacterium]
MSLSTGSGRHDERPAAKEAAMTGAGAGLRIAYLVNLYPAVSHTFIRREILALERQGVVVQRIALHGWEGVLADEQDHLERSRTQYVLRQGVLGLVWPVISTLLQSPLKFMSALGLALRLGWRAFRPLPYHLVFLAEACRILSWLRASGATHVHAHFGSNPAELALLVQALGGPSFSFTVHGPTEYDQPTYHKLGEKVERAAFVAAISSYGRSQLYRWVRHVHWPKIKVVHCAVEPSFQSIEFVAPPAAPRLVCVGRICHEKGQLLLVEAAARVVKKGIPLELVLAGDGPVRPEVDALIASLGLQAHVRVTGWLSGSQVRDEILAARALVLPSFAEGLPVVIMEAMALGRPVLTTYVAGIPELVLPGENGWLFPAGDVEAIATTMEACLATTTEELARMGHAARRRVLQRHDADTEAAKLIAQFSALKAATPAST